MDFSLRTEDHKDRLQPSASAFELAIKHARKYWFTLADDAITRLESSIICKVPALPISRLVLNEVIISESGSKAIFTMASSTFRPTKTEHDSTDSTTRNAKSAFFGKLGLYEKEDREVSNLTGIVSLAWAYILSSCLVELQNQNGAKISYTKSTANGQHHDGHHRTKDGTGIQVDIGEVDMSTARRWAAILAPERGWKAAVNEQSGEVYFSPWSVSLDNAPEFSIVWQDIGFHHSVSVTDPPSSKTALKALAEFCAFHGLMDQFYASLSAALMFPAHHDCKTTIKLPLPMITQNRVPQALKTDLMDEFLSLSNEMGCFITLSCNHRVIMSSLCGSFWESDASCNLVSPWLHPVLEEIPKAAWTSDNPGRYHEIVALMSDQRRPSLAILWIGAALSGLVPEVLQYTASGIPPLDPSGFSWTHAPQSFMDLPGSGPYFYTVASGNKAIKRVNVWRLLYHPTSEHDDLHYNNLPFSPWPPVGETSENSCALRVRAHIACPRHRLVYSHWTWQLQDGYFLPIYSPDVPCSQQATRALLPRQNPILDYPSSLTYLSQDASREASFEIFRWELANHEGKPPNESVYDDEWIAGCDDSEEYCSPIQGDSSSQKGYSDKEESAQRGRNSDRNFNPSSTSQDSHIMEWMANNS
ncbi:uncharacterized protein N7483_002852 [Penicillium malachiteum]|uniref:uncharacterized protein n=1 Tax=Penicillium malachiteum TaxID=1324776 RepID=UPI0025474E37|nr:uncharacterized protein N7483_002852 [Penicillium malachiteum]KAJ5737727.1 hypothetical protein N7483_002852 [Penicillium malachiteum]